MSYESNECDLDVDLQVDNGDLRAWEYITANFDDTGFIQDRNSSDALTHELHQTIGTESNSQSIETFHESTNRQDSSTFLGDKYVQNWVLCPERNDFSPVPLSSIPQSSPSFNKKFTTYQEHPDDFPSNESGVNIQSQQIMILESKIDLSQLYRENHQIRMASSGDLSINSLFKQASNMVELSTKSLFTESPTLSSSDMVDLPSNPLRLKSNGSTRQTLVYSPPLPAHALLKPFTAYRFFYRDERENILQGIATSGGIPEPVHDFSEARLRQLLDQRWYFDPNKKRRAHRKTLGKLGFDKFTEIITQRWQNLCHDGRQFYRQVADNEKAQYQRYLNFAKAKEAY